MFSHSNLAHVSIIFGPTTVNDSFGFWFRVIYFILNALTACIFNGSDLLPYNS